MPSPRVALSGRTRALLVGLAAVLAAATALPTAQAVAPSAPDGSAVRSSQTTRVVLPTGDTVSVGRTPDGRPSYGVLAADRSGIAGSFSNVDVAGDHYVLPGEVKPLLGSLVDPSLFDVTALAEAGGPARSTGVTATVTSASAEVPGLTVTRRTPTTLTGTVDAAGSAAFRSALVDAATAVASGHAQTSFPGVSRLSGTASAGVVTPDYPQVALKIAIAGPAGKPAPSAFVILVNTDDARRYDQFVFLDHGRARVSVPLGHYSAIASSLSFGDKRVTSLDIPVADYTVSRDAQTLTFDTTTATVEPSAVLPGSPAVDDVAITWTRADAGNHGSTAFSDEAGEGVTLRWTPTPAPDHGTQSWETVFHASGGTVAAPTTYDLSYRASGAVPRSGRHVASAADLATVDASFYEDERGQSAFGRGPLYPQDFGVFFTLYGLRTPARVTQYVGGSDDVTWFESLIGKTRVPHNFFGGDVVDQADLLTYRAGTHTQVDWLRGPLAPGPFEDSAGSRPSCSVCRTATKMQIALSPFTDTVPGHIGEGIDLGRGTPAIVTNLSADGRRIAGGRDRNFLQLPVSPDPRHYRLLVKADRSGDGATLSTSSLTTYGFTSSATTGGSVPSRGRCDLAQDVSSCRTLGLLRITAPLPTDLYRTVPVGTSTFRMTVAPYGGSTQRITSARVGIRVDDSAGFTPVTVTRVGAQQFDVTLTSPASWAGKPVTLRVLATDAAGDDINQTTTAAYAVAEN